MIKENIILKPTVCVKGICIGAQKKGSTYFFSSHKEGDTSAAAYSFRLVGVRSDTQEFTLEE